MNQLASEWVSFQSWQVVSCDVIVHADFLANGNGEKEKVQVIDYRQEGVLRVLNGMNGFDSVVRKERRKEAG